MYRTIGRSIELYHPTPGREPLATGPRVRDEGKNAANWDKQDFDLNKININNLPNGWSKTENNKFIHIRDANGQIRIRVDPPDSKTVYPHKHYYDLNKNPLDQRGNVVKPNSPDAHIPLE